MDSSQFEIDSLKNSLQQYLFAQAHKFSHESRPIVFRIDQRSSLQIIDLDKGAFLVNQTYFSSFKDIYSNTKYKFVSVHNWEFQLKFQGKQCKDIALTSDNVIFLASKTQRKQIRDCTFRVSVCDESSMNIINRKSKGYLNRLGKRHIVNQAENRVQDFYSLARFILPPKVNIIEKIQAQIHTESTPVDVDPLIYITKKGVTIIQKLRYFVTRQAIFDLITHLEVSEEGEKSLRKIILPEQQAENRRKDKGSREWSANK